MVPEPSEAEIVSCADGALHVYNWGEFGHPRSRYQNDRYEIPK